MKKQNWLINLSVIGLLWFALGFACKSSNDRSSGKTTGYDSGRKTVNTPSARDDDDDEEETTTTQTTRQTTGGELTEQDVRTYFTKYHMSGCDELYECKVFFRTPIEIGSATRRNIEGGLPPPEGGLALAYPVTVDVSFYKRQKSSQKGQWAQYHGGVHYFYRDVNLVWNDAPVGANLTFDDEER